MQTWLIYRFNSLPSRSAPLIVTPETVEHNRAQKNFGRLLGLQICSCCWIASSQERAVAQSLHLSKKKKQSTAPLWQCHLLAPWGPPNTHHTCCFCRLENRDSWEAAEGQGREKRGVPPPHSQRAAALLVLRVRVMVVDPALISFQGGANLHLPNDPPAVFLRGWNDPS